MRTACATRATTFDFDSHGRFLQSIDYPTPSSGVAQTETFDFDARFGGMTSDENVNGQTSTQIYDGFGRTILQRKPDNTALQTKYIYCSGINGGTASCTPGGVSNRQQHTHCRILMHSLWNIYPVAALFRRIGQGRKPAIAVIGGGVAINGAIEPLVLCQHPACRIIGQKRA